MTELTDNTVREARGIVFFDGACGACTAGANRFEVFLGKRGFRFIPLQAPEAEALTHLPPDELRREMKLRLADGHILGGFDALLYLARSVPWIRPFSWLATIPPIRSYLARFYDRAARNRYRLSADCRIGEPRRIYAHLAWLVALVVTALIVVSKILLPPWATMWLIAFAIYFALKLLTLPGPGGLPPGKSHTSRILAYLFAWPGLDAPRFLSNTAPKTIDRAAIIPALLSLIIGATFLWIVPRFLAPTHPLLVGWLGMLGLVNLLHFGLLQLISITWQFSGVDAPLMMERPLRASSVSDFWARWNRPFRTVAFRYVFHPLRRFGLGFATMVTFIASGIIHDLTISTPAGAGFGGPTLYFVIQAIGILIEKKLKFSARWLGRLFTFAVLIVPLPLLFHAPFIERVMLPFMHVIGALGKELP
ncbi:MAG TPA: DCC1-like thiol-disulfide oxidoreductase family protein [Tepidisphaeraceae bacterium]|jgi:alginate O-acetyltransferase complex protein AlgI|nr:DCC1-like thiol-disulfide oxidoreductase family protein [Tepidisphaeraceae bacterium]